MSRKLLLLMLLALLIGTLNLASKVEKAKARALHSYIKSESSFGKAKEQRCSTHIRVWKDDHQKLLGIRTRVGARYKTKSHNKGQYIESVYERARAET